MKITIILYSFILLGCKDALKEYYKQMENFGFIAYTTPLQYSGTGTIVGGTPDRLVVAAVPETCFPDKFDGKNTDIRFIEETTLPSKYKDIEVQTGFTTDFLKFIGAGSPPISAGIKFNLVKNLNVSFEGATIEIIDTIKLKNYYSNLLHDDCKILLEKFGVIIEALRIDKMKITFYTENGVDLNLKSDETINNILKLGAGVKYSVIDQTKLIIESPKYIAYRIAKLQKKDQGIAMIRSSKLKNNKFVFENIAIFNEDIKINKYSKKIGEGVKITEIPFLDI